MCSHSVSSFSYIAILAFIFLRIFSHHTSYTPPFFHPYLFTFSLLAFSFPPLFLSYTIRFLLTFSPFVSSICRRRLWRVPPVTSYIYCRAFVSRVTGQ